MNSMRFPELLVIGCLVLSSACKKASSVAESSHESSETIQLVDIATDATDPYDSSDTEPSIAVNPANPNEIAVVAFSGAWGDGAMAPVWKSRDGGVHWSKVPQIPPPASGWAGPGDQKIAYDSAGHLVIAELGEDTSNPNGPTKNFVYHQVSGPDDPLKPGTTYGDDQPHIVLAVQTTSCKDDLYSVWLNTQPSNARSMDSSSADLGDHVSDVSVGDNHLFPNRTTRVATAPDGKAYVVYKTREGQADGTFEDVHFRVLRSDDCGATFNGLGQGAGVSISGDQKIRTFFTDNFGNHSKGKVARARSSDAWISTTTQPGEVYVAYVSRDQSGFAQIFVAHSKDSGSTWSSTRVTNGKNHSAFPEIAVAQNGNVGVMYIDFDDSQTRTVFRHRFAISIDSGKTWQNATLQKLDPDGIQNAADGFLWGDYEGLAAANNVFYGVFTGDSINRTLRQLDPIFFKVSAAALQ
ncbi:MAG: sialidase family protein [Candidatus Sulfotelmatobacter sp.]